MNKQTFLQYIKEAKWFHVKGNYGQSFLVKMKPVTYPEIDTFIETLWLSKTDWEAMCFSEYDSSSWDFVNNQFVTNAASTYHFGSTEGSVEDSIYKESGELDVEKMKQKILNYARKDFIKSDELDKVWEKLQNNELSNFEILDFK